MQVLNFLNFNPIKFQNVNFKGFYSTSPIKSALESDTVEFSQVDETKKEITRVEKQIIDMQAEVMSIDAEMPEVKATFDTYYKKISPLRDERVKLEAKKLYAESEEAIQEIDETIEQIDSQIRAIEKENKDITRPWVIASKRDKLQKRIDEQEIYLIHLKEHPRTAFLYNPELSNSKKQMVAKTKGIPAAQKFAQSLNISLESLALYRQAGLVEDEKAGSVSFFDKETEKNAEFIKLLEGKNYDTALSTGFKYGLMQRNTEKLLASRKLKPLGLEGFEPAYKSVHCLIDLDDEENIEAIKKQKRITVNTSPYTDKIGQPGALIPARALYNMGLGDVKTIRELVQKGTIKGTIKSTVTKKGPSVTTLVDASRPESINYLIDMTRTSRKNIKTLASELRISQKRIKEAIETEDVEIINEYLPGVQNGKDTYIDVTRPKNRQFIERVNFENEILAQQRELKRQERIENKKKTDFMSSLRMSLVWKLCPQTKALFSSVAKEDGYVCQLLIKDSNEEELSNKEQAVVNSYRKACWQIMGTEEYQKAHAKAKEYLALYFSQGIDAIDNEEVKEVFRTYFD